VIEKIQKQTFITTPFLEKVMKDSEDIQRLIRLKKYETPGDEYFESFLEDFKDRQRSELLRQSARGLLLERVSMWFDEVSGPRWLVPVGASAAAALALGIYTIRLPLSEDTTPASDLASLTTESLPNTLATNPSATNPPAAIPVDATPWEDEHAITLQLPRRDQRVPGLGLDGIRQPETQGLVPASARSHFREL